MKSAAGANTPNRRRQPGIRYGLVLIAGLCVMVVTIAGAASIISQARQSQIETWKINVSNLSTTLAEHTEQSFKAADLVLQSIQAKADELGIVDDADLRQQMGTRSIFETLRDKMAGVPQIGVVAVVSLSGDIVNFSRTWPVPPLNVADRDYFQALGKSPYPGVFLSRPVHNRGTGAMTFYLARQIHGRYGQLAGMVLVGLSSQFYQDFFKAVSPSEAATLSLIRTDGVLLAREPLDTETIGESLASRPAFRDVMARVSAGAVLMEGRPLPGGGTGPIRFAAPRRLRDYPVISDIALDESDALLNWRTHSRMIALLSGFLVAIVLFATFLVASLLRGQDQTLAQLTEAHRRAETEAAAKSQLLADLRGSETRLTEKSGALEVTLENMEQGLLMVGPDGIIPVCNRRVIEMLDLPEEVLSGAYKFDDLLAYQWRIGEFALLDPGLQAFVRGGGIQNAPAAYERLRPNGTTIEVRSIPLKGGGLVRTYSDVTDRNRTAALLVAAKEHAEAASRAKSDFLANMSHEIRTPMNGILGMNALLLDSGLNDQQFKYASMAYESSEAMLRVINDILDISKLEARRVELEVLEFDLAELAGSVTGLLGGRAEENGVALTVTIDPALPHRFRGDPTRLRQILLNLISNGIKFTRNGSVGLTVAPVAGATRFEVVDTGSGIAPDALGRLFEKFNQADSSITRRHGGTGLGLAICRELVELMGGRIGVASQLGSGSCFWFELPTAALALESAAGVAGDVPSGVGAIPHHRVLHVLVGEDNPINQQVMRAMLARAGHTMRIVDNGEDVVQAVSEGNFDVVLMDIQMPRLDGLEATRKIRDMEAPKGRIPIIAVTADAMTGARDHYVRAGMDGYLAKPLRFRELVATIEAVALEPFTAAS